MKLEIVIIGEITIFHYHIHSNCAISKIDIFHLKNVKKIIKKKLMFKIHAKLKLDIKNENQINNN
jgi:hypothetical protein